MKSEKFLLKFSCVRQNILDRKKDGFFFLVKSSQLAIRYEQPAVGIGDSWLFRMNSSLA